MNEFYSPNSSRRENTDKSETTYAEPADELNIVVDDGDTGAAFCYKCGNRLDPGDAFCSRCGAKTFGTEQTQTQTQTSVRQDAMAQDKLKEFFAMTDTKPQNGNYTINITNINNGGVNTNSANINSGNGSTVYSDVHTGKKNKWVSLLLCFFLGWFGAHRFYEGKIATGVLYFFTVGLFGIGWLIDLLILLGKPHYYDP